MPMPNDSSRAEYMFRQALDIFDKINNIEIRAASYFNLATVLCLRGNLEEGEQMLEQALKDYHVIGNQCMSAQVKSLLGTVKHGKEELNKALKIQEQTEGTVC